MTGIHSPAQEACHASVTLSGNTRALSERRTTLTLHARRLIAVTTAVPLFALTGWGGGSSGGADAAVTSQVAATPDGTRATMALLETTDLHTSLLSYDSYKLAEDKSLGFERTATLIA